MKVPSVITSLLVHGAVLYAMSRLPEAPKRKPPTVVEMKVTQTRKEPPPPPPPPPEEVIPPPKVEPKLVKVRTAKEIVKDAPPPPPPEAPPPPPPPPKLSFSVDMASTVEGGGVAVPAIEGGGNMFADPEKDAALPAGKGTTPTPPPSGNGKDGPADGYQITEPPRFLTPESEREPPYPRLARSKEIEGKVVLRVYIGEDGSVRQVEVLKRLGGGCTEAAVKWAKTKWRFAPARSGDEAVGMWITVPVRFVLER